jgi:predicted RNA binding protein YcfA (HicA-like mRNA interferase family)
LIKKLKELAGLEFVRNGANHDVYRARNGKKIQIPRHPRDLGRGLVRNILQQAGLNIGIEEFLQH